MTTRFYQFSRLRVLLRLHFSSACTVSVLLQHCHAGAAAAAAGSMTVPAATAPLPPNCCSQLRKTIAEIFFCGSWAKKASGSLGRQAFLCLTRACVGVCVFVCDYQWRPVEACWNIPFSFQNTAVSPYRHRHTPTKHTHTWTGTHTYTRARRHTQMLTDGHQHLHLTQQLLRIQHYNITLIMAQKGIIIFKSIFFFIFTAYLTFSDITLLLLLCRSTCMVPQHSKTQTSNYLKALLHKEGRLPLV